jgi:DNA-binding transcriptional LysR family regulator
MELRDLEYFAIVAKHGHVGRAAESLGLSQPALSKSLRRLETAMKAKLVKRTPKGVELTAVGSALRKHVHRLRLSLDDVVHEAIDLSEGRAGDLRIGAGAGMGDHFIAHACSIFLMEAPKATLALTVEPNAVLRRALLNGELDLIVSGTPHASHNELIQERLFDDDFVAYAAANHRLVRRRNLTLTELVEERWALSAPDDLSWNRLHRVFEDNGLPPPRIAFQTNAYFLRAQTVSSSDMLSFSSTRALDFARRFLPLTALRVKDLAWTRHVGVSYRKDSYLPPAARRFIEIIKSTAREWHRE